MMYAIMGQMTKDFAEKDGIAKGRTSFTYAAGLDIKQVNAVLLELYNHYFGSEHTSWLQALRESKGKFFGAYTEEGMRGFRTSEMAYNVVSHDELREYLKTIDSYGKDN